LITSPFKGLPREVSILIGASFFVAVGFGIVMPASPVFAKSFGVNNAAIGLMVSAFAITRFASGLISWPTYLKILISLSLIGLDIIC
jgi:predicted MFS family arabinose efflux permease